MTDFADLLAANESYAADFRLHGFDGIARRGVAMVTCMDSRLEPLEMIGLEVGDAKILRTPGAHLTPDALRGCVLGVQLLGVTRILLVPHTKCAMAKGDDDMIRGLIRESSQVETDMSFGATVDQRGRLATDVHTLRVHPLIQGRAEVGGFLYDVDTGRLDQLL